MIAYEFYWHNGRGKEHLVGILPERRKDPERITRDSIMKWGRMVLGDQSGVNPETFYFVRLEV
ncbi:MAG: hypothetical protein EHM36_16520 [Deltaproteobacteria bacterium]|nr:MAG: hypothetical protein EHM36_16520 [Deltaproteobacteria bacterium]